MKYIYSLTSSLKDNYYEQFLLSLTSLRLFMPNAEVTLLCDSSTRETLTGHRNQYEKLISNVITVDTPVQLSQIEVSRWLKTSMRRHVKGNFLFIDCDTIITDDLSSIENMSLNIAACLDKHLPINAHGKSKYIIENDKKLKFTSYFSNKHFNSGVIYCADTLEAHKIFDRWHELWLYSKSKKILRDQPSFNMAIYENTSDFTELNGIWNCQIAYNGLPYLSDAKIIHYFASDFTFNTSPFLFASEIIYKEIKENGTIPEDALKLLKKPKAAFSCESRIICGKEITSVINSSVFDFILLIRLKSPALFRVINKIFSIFKKTAKTYIIKSSKKKDGGIKHYN